MRRTKIIATIGPASSSPEVIRQLILAGMDVARLNFSHGTYDDHARVIKTLRKISAELDKPVTILQDLQGPKIRVGILSRGQLELTKGTKMKLVPEELYSGSPDEIPIDYPFIAEEAQPGMQVLLDDGLLEMKVTAVDGDPEQNGVRRSQTVICEVIEGGPLKQRKGVNFPNLDLKLPSLTEKDKMDLEFGIGHDVDWISLSFVRDASDVRELKSLINSRGVEKPVIAKIEKPQAVKHLEEIIEEAQGIMVARGDLGVEMSPERVPLLQKSIIELCNKVGKPVITATQMLESMMHESRPTRAEASDVANAIIDGTDCLMLSGETAAGKFPVKAVEMMSKIATEVEGQIQFKTYPAVGNQNIMALSEATNIIDKIANPHCVVVLTASGRSARFVAADRPMTPIYAMTTSLHVYHGLNLLWGINPILVSETSNSFDSLIELVSRTLRERGLATEGDKIVIVGGIPAGIPGGSNFIKIHMVGS
ncbi:MAG: pyruvate kinase [Bacteroidales bacterium]|nr:pyruvate kinase [Bacteroidales bacterium]